MRALVTGAAGFVGSHVAQALLAAGAEVRGFDLAPGDGGCELVVGDVCDRAALARAIDGCDAVFHVAAVYSYRRADAARMRAVNVEGTRNVLDAALRGARARRVVHTSSCATCGPVAGRAATEADAPAAWELRVPYKRTKLDGEALALAAAREGADVVVVNPTTPVGPGDRRPTPTGRMVADVARGRARAYLARSALNIVAVEDVAGGQMLAYERGAAGRRYLLGGENLSLREVFAVIATAAGRRAPSLPVPWTIAYAAGLASSAALGAIGREPALLNLDEIRVARLPMAFDDARARAELGYSSRPAAGALAAAALASVA
ncbi:MAG TPA: NAD-dependent epimerase/dehydratase family protein [Solirubrobacteraceae bacterium]|nr:NAD-dependent epimerase/dehydratase family protein [Solirubrobacteraceae bacterium]